MVAPNLPVQYPVGYIGSIGNSLKIYKIIEVKLAQGSFKKAVLVKPA